MNDHTQFGAKILKRANIGKTADDLVAQWNAEQSDDPVGHVCDVTVWMRMIRGTLEV